LKGLHVVVSDHTQCMTLHRHLGATAVICEAEYARSAQEIADLGKRQSSIADSLHQAGYKGAMRCCNWHRPVVVAVEAVESAVGIAHDVMRQLALLRPAA